MALNPPTALTASDAPNSPPINVPGSSIELLERDAPILVPLKVLCPDLDIYTRSNPSYASRRQPFNRAITSQPVAIVSPKTEDQVADIVRFCGSQEPVVPFVVRAGGHDTVGRSCVEDALIIDLCEFDSISLLEDRKSAKVGGGVIGCDLVKFLDPHSLATPIGFCPTVGYGGWALYAGYGFLCGTHGLGVDQIIGARLVNAKGEIIEADEELLWALRGAGGNFGVVLELTIKVYELPKMLGGFVVFKPGEDKKVLEGFMKLLEEGHPDPFSGDLSSAPVPGIGPATAVCFAWTSTTVDAGKAYLEKVRSLGTVVMDSVRECTLLQLQEEVAILAPPVMSFKLSSFNIAKMTPKFIEVMLNNLPKEGSMNAIDFHNCHGVGAEPHPSSCFGNRKNHIVIEMIGMATPEMADKEEAAYDWVDKMTEDLRESGEVTSERWFINMEGDDVKNGYKDGWDRLLALKKKHDPKNVFGLAVPKLV